MQRSESTLRLDISERGGGGLTHSIELLEMFMYRIMNERRKRRIQKGYGEVFMEMKRYQNTLTTLGTHVKSKYQAGGVVGCWVTGVPC